VKEPSDYSYGAHGLGGFPSGYQCLFSWLGDDLLEASLWMPSTGVDNVKKTPAHLLASSSFVNNHLSTGITQ
jgi:hypothetical protein